MSATGAGKKNRQISATSDYPSHIEVLETDIISHYFS